MGEKKGKERISKNGKRMRNVSSPDWSKNIDEKAICTIASHPTIIILSPSLSLILSLFQHRLCLRTSSSNTTSFCIFLCSSVPSLCVYVCMRFPHTHINTYIHTHIHKHLQRIQIPPLLCRCFCFAICWIPSSDPLQSPIMATLVNNSNGGVNGAGCNGIAATAEKLIIDTDPGIGDFQLVPSITWFFLFLNFLKLYRHLIESEAF